MTSEDFNTVIRHSNGYCGPIRTFFVLADKLLMSKEAEVKTTFALVQVLAKHRGILHQDTANFAIATIAGGLHEEMFVDIGCTGSLKQHTRDED
jgi:hypothetical protein